MDDKKNSAVDGFNSIVKSDLSKEKLSELFSEQIAQENILQVGVQLNRPRQVQPGKYPYIHTVVSVFSFTHVYGWTK